MQPRMIRYADKKYIGFKKGLKAQVWMLSL